MISPAEADSIAAEFMVQHQEQSKFLPLHERISSRDAAYNVKDAYVARLRQALNSDVCGYKIGLTALKLQQMMKTDEPTEGEVLSVRRFDAPYSVSLSDYGRLGIESEICVVLGTDLKSGSTRADVSANLSAISAAYELIDDRAADYGAINALSLIADNSWNAAVVLGDPGSGDLDLSARKGVLSCNENVVGEGTTADAIGHTLDMVVWLAQHLGKRGKYLRAGELVMTGSLIPPVFPKAGETYVFEVEGLMPVELVVKA